MPLPVHDSVADASGSVMVEMREAVFLSRAERSQIIVNVGTDVELPMVRSLSRAGTKCAGGTATKQADANYFLDKRVTVATRCVPACRI